MTAATNIDWSLKPAIQTAPHHHFCSVLERGDIEEKLHSSHIDVFDAGIRLDGRKNRPRLVEVIAVGPGRWVPGGRQPREVEVGQLCYVKERTVPFRLHLRKQNHFFIPMDGVLAQLDHENVRLKPCGAFVMTREVDERSRVAVMGSMPFHIGNTPGTGKKGEEADDIGCNKTRIEEVIAVGPGKFGGFRPDGSPYWEAPDCKPGDLVVFTDMARPTEITLAGKKVTLFESDFIMCTVLDQAI